MILLNLTQLFTVEWFNILDHPRELRVEDNTLLGIVPHLPKGWKITFDIFASKYDWKTPGSSVIYMVEGNHNGTERTVAIISFTKLNVAHDSANGLHILMTSIQEGADHFKISKQIPELETWTTIEFSQSLVDASYSLNLMYNGIGVLSRTLSPEPYTYEYVQVWVGGQQGNLGPFQILSGFYFHMIPIILNCPHQPSLSLSNIFLYSQLS